MTKITKSPLHGTTNDTPESESQPDGTGANAPRGETQAQPSGPHGGNPATAGKRDVQLRSQTPENREGRLNPSAPTEGTEIDQASTRGASRSDTFGEAGDPRGRGNLEVPEQVVDKSGPSPTADKPGPEGAGDVKRERDEEAA